MNMNSLVWECLVADGRFWRSVSQDAAASVEVINYFGNAHIHSYPERVGHSQAA